ncbi:MAG: phosphotransferase family protein [Lacipirellulaceae bacterium]|uniref:phosphotransferase family protein n=1 Tax=Marinobacter salarius TaxID=1420917 RepID=UPI0032EEEE94
MAIKNTLNESDAKLALAAWLARQQYHEDATSVEIINIEIPHASGLSAITVLFTARWHRGGEITDRNLVARCVPRSGGVFEHCDLRREYILFKALSDEGSVPIPKPLGIETEDDSALGAPFFIMERVDGQIARDDPPYTVQGWVTDLSVEDRGLLSHHALSALAAIHAVDYKKLGLSHLDDSGAGAPQLAIKVAALKRYFKWAAAGQSNPVIEKGLDWLEQNIPEHENEPVISWGDARLGNMIINDDLSVAAVIDWEMVGLGCREIDLAWWIFVQRFHTVAIEVEVPAGIPSEQEVVARYTELTGYTPQNLEYYILFAAVRLSVILVRLANIMIAEGLFGEDTPMARNNPALKLLALGLGMDGLEGELEYFVGNR